MGSSTTKDISELIELLKIPSISGQSEHRADVDHAAEWLCQYLGEIGLENCRIMPTEGMPIVYADWLHAHHKPTLLIYGHYDVQAADPLDLWVTPPFEPTIRNGNLYGRGTADDKGQLFTYFKAMQAILAKSKQLPVNIKFLIEGEEEIGGIHLDDFIKDHRDLLKADVCLISDSHSESPSQPLIPYGLKGLVYFQLELSVMPKDVHSGSYGGNVPNAGIEMASLISKLKDFTTQEVLIPGFYDNVRVVDSEEKRELKKSSFTATSVLSESGAKQIVGVAGYSVAERGGARPTLDINGMHAGYTGEGPKTIIPARASVKISMRLVPNQTSQEIVTKFARYLKKITPKYVDLESQLISAGEPILMDRHSQFFAKAEDAMSQVFGAPPKYCLEGGSIPVTATLKTLLGIDSILMGFGLPDDGLHSPNEKLNLDMFYKGIKTISLFLQSFTTHEES